MPISVSNLKPAVSGLTSNVHEGVVFELLRGMMPSSDETPYLRTELMQQMRDMWRERYEAMRAYTTEELVRVAKANQNQLSPELTRMLGNGSASATEAQVARWSAAERRVRDQRMERELHDLGIDVMGPEHAAEVLDTDTVNQVLSGAGITDVAQLTDEQCAVYAFESMLREPEFIEAVGERHVIDDLTQSVAATDGDTVNPNVAAFNAQLNSMKAHTSGVYDYDEATEGGDRVAHRRSYMVPLSPLDPAYRDRMCSYDSGAGQMMFASMPLDTAVNEATALTYEHAREMLDTTVRTWPYNYLGNAMNVPVAVVYEAPVSGEVQYVGAGHVGMVEGKYATFRGRLSTIEDAVGFSDIRFLMIDDANYRQATERAIEAWSERYEQSRALADNNDRDAFVDAVNMQRRLVKTMAVPMIDHLQRIGGTLELKPDRESGQVMIEDTEHDLTMRVVEKVPEASGDAAGFSRARWMCKVRTRNADGIEFNLRDPRTGNSLIGNKNGSAMPVITDEQAVGLYGPEIRAKSLDFLCGYTDDIELNHLREAGALVYPDTSTRRDGTRGAQTSRNALISASDVSNGSQNAELYIEVPLSRVENPFANGNPNVPDEVIVTMKVMVTREDTESFLDRREENTLKRDPEEQANIAYDEETGRARRLVDENGEPFAEDDQRAYISNPTYEDRLRGAIANARYNLTNLINVNELIQEARSYNISDDRQSFVAPSPDNNGTITDAFVIGARRDLWNFLTRRKDVLDKPYWVSDAEMAETHTDQFQADWNEVDVDETASDEVQYGAEQARREQYVRDYVEAALDKRIGGFDPSESRDGRRFNPAAVLAYAGGMGGAMGRQRMISMLRTLEMNPSELIADGVGKNGSDRDAQAIQNAIDPFRTETAQTLEQLRAQAASENEAEAALAQYKVQILDAVKSSASMLSVRPLEDADVAIDDSGLVRYTFDVMKRVQVAAPTGRDGRTATYDSPDQRDAVLDNARTVTGYIGRFAVPERTNAGLLRSMNHFGENKIYAPQTHAFLLPQDGLGTDRIERTRGLSFDDRLASMIRSRVFHDIATTYSKKFKDTEIGDFTAMHSMYGSEETSDTISAEHYDRIWADIEAAKNDPMTYVAEGMQNLVDGLLDRPLRYEHGMQPMKSEESQIAMEETMAHQVVFSEQYIKADVTAEVRGAAGFNARASERYRDCLSLAGGQPLAVKTKADAQVFDKHQTPDNAKQTTKNHLNVGAAVYRDKAPTFDPEHTRCATGELDQFKHSINDEWNRVRMGQANAVQELGQDLNAHVVMMGGAGFTQNDGVVVSKEWAILHGIYGADEKYRPLMVGDKISDYRGNKGTIARVVDVADTEEAALAKGESYHNMWKIFRANSETREYTVPLDPSDPTGPVETVTLPHCNIDVVMNSVSFTSRLNGGLLRDGLDGPTETLHLPNQPDVEAGIFTTGISIHNKLADEHNLENNSRSGWQLGMSVIDDMPSFMAEMYGDNVNGFLRLRESLNVAVGYDFTADGTIVSGIQNSDGMERNVIDYERVESVSNTTLAEQQKSYAEENAPGQIPTPVIGVEHAINLKATRETARTALSQEGGFLSVPFELTFPERHVPSNQFTDDELQLMGVEPGEDVVIGGGRLPSSSERTRNGDAMWAFPVESAPGRAGIEQRGQTVRHDHMREYTAILDAAVEYENSLIMEHAHREEAARIREGIELYQRDPNAEGAIDPSAPNTGVYRGLKDTPQGSFRRIGGKMTDQVGKQPMTWLEVLGAYTARTDGVEAARAVLDEFGAPESSYKRLSATNLNPARMQTFADERAAMQDRAQTAFTKMSDDVWRKNFTGSSNAIKEYAMRSKIVNSKYTVWTANPDCDIDEVRISPEVAQRLGVDKEHSIDGNDPQYVALWRSPVLRSMNLAAFRYRIDPSITGVAVNPAVTTRISGDFDGDHVALYYPKYPETQAELARERSFARYLVDDHIEPDGTFTARVNGVETEIPKYALGIDMGLDGQLGRTFDKEADTLMTVGYQNACVAWYQYEQVASGVRDEQKKLDELEYFAKRENGGVLPEEGVKLPESEQDETRGILTTADKRHALDTQLKDALDTRDYMCNEAFAKLNRGIKQAQASSAEHGVISFAGDVELVESMLDATVRPGVKGKAGQIENLMSHMGYIPYQPDVMKEIIDNGEATDEKRGVTYHSMREYLEDKSLFGIADAVESHVPEGSFINLDQLRDEGPENFEDFTQEIYDAVRAAWEDMRFDEDASTSLAMNAKTTVTALVGVLPQCGHESLEGKHELVADVTEPMYQMSLDFKLDGQDALRKIPWVNVWNQCLRRGQLFEELLDPDAAKNGTIPAPDELTPCKMVKLGSTEKGTVLTPDNLKVALKNVYAMCDQSLAESKIDQFVDAMVCDYDEVDGKTVSACRSLDDIAALRGSNLARIAFDSGRFGAAMVSVAKRGERLFEGDAVKMASGYVRDKLGDPVPNHAQALRYADQDTPMVRSNAAAHTTSQHAMNTRGFDAACAAEATHQHDVKVAIFVDRDFFDKMDDEGVKHLYRTINETIKPELKGLYGNGMNLDALAEPCFEAVYVTNANSATEYAATMEAINAADLVVMAGDGSSTSMDKMLSFAKNPQGRLRYFSDEKLQRTSTGDAPQSLDAGVNEDAKTVRISFDGKSTEGIDILARAAEAQTAVLDVNLRRVATAEERANTGHGQFVTTSMYRFDRDMRLSDVIGRGDASDRAVKQESWNQAVAQGNLTVAFTGSLPEQYLVANPADKLRNESDDKFRARMHYANGEAEQASYEMVKTKVKTFLRGQLAQMDHLGKTDGEITVITGGGRGADYLAFAAANELSQELSCAGSTHRVRTVVELPFDDQEHNWDQRQTNPKSPRTDSYFTQDVYKHMIQNADEVHYPGVSLSSTRDGEQTFMPAARRAGYFADRDERMVDAANLVVKVENSARPTKDQRQTASERMVDYAVEQGKFTIDIDSNRNVGAILRGNERTVTNDIRRRTPQTEAEATKLKCDCIKRNPRVSAKDHDAKREHYPTEVTNVDLTQSLETVQARLAEDAKAEAERQAKIAAEKAAKAAQKAAVVEPQKPVLAPEVSPLPPKVQAELEHESEQTPDPEALDF